MNTFSIEQLRKDVRSWVTAPGKSVLQLAKASGVEQKSLARFVAKQAQTGLSGASIEKLWPFLYGDHPQQRASGE